MSFSRLKQAAPKTDAEALQNKQLVPGVVVSGGGKDGGQPNATDLISLLTAKAANDLGVAVTAGQQKTSAPAVSQ